MFDFLEEIENELDEPIRLIAVGGTALTLLDAKPSTIDADFTLPTPDYYVFKKALRNTPHGFNVDCWAEGMVFSQILPEDYLTRSTLIKKMKRIHLGALNPVDIVVSKIGRLDERDKEDIQTCIKKFKLKKNQILERAEKIEYVGREKNYEINLDYVVKRFFG